MTTGEVFQNLMLVLGGLALFIYGIDLMSNSLKSAAGNRLKVIIEKTTNARWKGILVGIALTVLIQSSSAVTVLIIGLLVLIYYHLDKRLLSLLALILVQPLPQY